MWVVCLFTYLLTLVASYNNTPAVMSRLHQISDERARTFSFMLFHANFTEGKLNLTKFSQKRAVSLKGFIDLLAEGPTVPCCCI